MEAVGDRSGSRLIFKRIFEHAITSPRVDAEQSVDASCKMLPTEGPGSCDVNRRIHRDILFFFFFFFLIFFCCCDVAIATCTRTCTLIFRRTRLRV